MAEIRIVTEVAGRICALPVGIGGRVESGAEIALVEAMKMEIPVAAPASGTVISIAVKLDDVVSEGQVIAFLES